MKTISRQEEQILLAIHNLGKDAYLITIREKIVEYTGKDYSVGTIYVPLNRLDKNGYLESFSGEADAVRGGKAKKFYRITTKGYEALMDLKKNHEMMWEGFTLPSRAGSGE